MKLVFCLFFMLSSFSLFAEEDMKFKVCFDEDRIDAIVSVQLERWNYNTDELKVCLFEIVEGKEIPHPCQSETGHATLLWFIVPGLSKKDTRRNFVLRKDERNTLKISKVKLQKDGKVLALSVEGSPILKYRYAVTLPPKGVDSLYQRSGYIHPLVSPGGKVLTQIQPKDHYHHYGIWGPWTKTHIDGREVDFWNLKKGMGTVKFTGFLSETEGEVFSGFKSHQQHIDFGAKGTDSIALNEILDVRVWNTQDDVRIIDYTTSLNCPLENGILLDAYRYGGGLAYRATETWNQNNCTILTSAGKTRIDADGSRARWLIVEGESEVKEGRSGILFLSHPANRMHPEPIRAWPKKNGRVFIDFTPIRYKEWKLSSKRDYTLKYRMVVFDGKMDAKTAEMYWQSFAKQPQVIISACPKSPFSALRSL